MNIVNSEALFEQAQHLIPGGVNSPVRAFGSVGGTPRFIKQGDGAYIWDVDGNRYIDYVLSWGPLILGHAHPTVVEAIERTAKFGTSYGAPTKLENELAQLVIDIVPSIEMIRFVNSGTEACMSALRLARAYTGRDKIIKFSGNYHGHADMLLVQAGSGVATFGLPDSPGVPKGTTENTLTAPYNDLAAVQTLLEQYPDSIAGAIVEPIAANMGFILPDEGYLQSLIELCHEHGALLILDEVMTGFRVALGGAQEAFNLDPDITCLGKVIGGGLPVGAYGGKREIMQAVAPLGTMYQAGTLSGNPLAMAAGLATITELKRDGAFQHIASITHQLVAGLGKMMEDHSVPVQVGQAGTMFGFYFLREAGANIRDYETAKRYADTERYAAFFHSMLKQGIYFAPSQFEAGFLSGAHNGYDIDTSLAAVHTALEK